MIMGGTDSKVHWARFGNDVQLYREQHQKREHPPPNTRKSILSLHLH